MGSTLLLYPNALGLLHTLAAPGPPLRGINGVHGNDISASFRHFVLKQVPELRSSPFFEHYAVHNC